MGGAFAGDISTSVLYRNPGNANHWVTLELEGVKANRSAIGAKLDIMVEEHGVTRRVYRTVEFGSSLLQAAKALYRAGSRPPYFDTLHQSSRAQPYMLVERIPAKADRMFHLREGDVRVRQLNLKSFKIGGGTVPAMGPVAGMKGQGAK